MKKPKIHFYWYMALYFCVAACTWWSIATPGFTADMTGEPVIAAGVSEDAEQNIAALDFLKDERLIEVENEYSDAIAAKVAEAAAAENVAEAERLQKEVHQLKGEAELEIKKVMLDIAMEQGDGERIARLQDDLDALYYPGGTQPDNQGPSQESGGQIMTAAPQNKNADDQ